MTSETQQRHYARSSVTNVLSLEQTSPRPTSLSKLLGIHEINFEENWRYRTLSKLETLFHVTNVTTVLNASVASDRVSRCLSHTLSLINSLPPSLSISLPLSPSFSFLLPRFLPLSPSLSLRGGGSRRTRVLIYRQMKLPHVMMIGHHVIQGLI